MNKANFTDSKKLKIQTSMLRSKKVIKKNVKNLRHHVVKMLQISITRNSTICKLKFFCFFFIMLLTQIFNFREFEQNLRL